MIRWDTLTEEKLIEYGFKKGDVFNKEGCRLSFRNYGTRAKPDWGVFVDGFMDTSLICKTTEQLETLINLYE